MTRAPYYITHKVDERDVTVDWFFSRRLSVRQAQQFLLMIGGWLFALLPIVITTSALLHEHTRGGWWHYAEGFRMWDTTIRMLEFLIAAFIIIFFTLYVLHRIAAGKRDRERTFDEERLARRLELAGGMYEEKYGDEAFRLEQKKIAIEPYEDIETYELRDLYREYGVD